MSSSLSSPSFITNSPPLLWIQTHLNNPDLSDLKNICLLIILYQLVLLLFKLFFLFYSALWVYGPSRTFHGLKNRLDNLAFRCVKWIPSVKKELESRIRKATKDIEDKVAPQDESSSRYTSLPKHGFSKEFMDQELDRYSTLPHTRWEDGRVSGAVYHHDTELTNLAARAYKAFMSSNPMHPEVFPGVRKMEAEVVAMVADMFHAGPEAGGTLTSGGTESILMSCRTHREWGRAVKGITKPEMICPTTIHPAFDKAANYFGIKMILVPIDPVTMQVDLKAVKRAINSNTILLAGSAVSYPHGIMDDIVTLGKLAQKHNIGLHVDCCLGSFMIAFAEKAGYSLPPFDFRVPGVTALSCDTHKYGFAPKGSSVIVYHTKEMRRFQYFTRTDWPGGVYASPSVAGSRPGALIAGCWVTMMHLGEEGYIRETKRIIDAQIKVRRAIEHIPTLYVYGEPRTSVVAFNSTKFNIYDICDQMAKRGWHLAALQNPPGVHFTSTIPSSEVSEEFIIDLQAVMMDFEEGKMVEKGATAGIYGMAATVPASVVAEVAGAFVDALYKP
ncbi:hypothetical protein BGZ95_002787 [Linnemannia exigua]|uniref:sphinganine-1-phosphate aldolase n=1 Tax=Linnemannia exigua TaxID=604196 RepID=A0AAD4D778_9FUNG|nr:hypothetical protein BGZ95_002787 [Linnemannia exigua]